MDENKSDIPSDRKENVSSNSLSRRSFVEQAGLAGLLASTIPIQSIAAGSDHDSGVSPASEPAEDVSSQVPQNAETETEAMPLIKIDAYEGRSESEVTTLLDAVHRAVVKAFHVPLRDRYQIYQAHPKSCLVIQDTGLGITRTNKAVIVTVVSKKRDEILKRRLYKGVDPGTRKFISDRSERCRGGHHRELGGGLEFR